ncbi:MAG: flagellar basal body L-ring protein FlgH [Armatimonadetes bacterium]|nr:flagellar basal body L-ring protein FlgH [Armatimonadota bacterium]
MKKLLLLLAVTPSVLLAQADDNNPGSLWPKHCYTNPLLDRVAKHEGDLLTVIINESSSANFSATTSTSRTEKTDIGNINVPVLTNFFKSLGLDNSSSYKGDGSSTQTGNLTAQMTVTVKKVMPNGVLMIEGVRWVRVNKENQNLLITGLVRQDDIRSDNTVLSSNIANAEIKVDAKGQIANQQRRGIFSRILEWLF